MMKIFPIERVIDIFVKSGNDKDHIINYINEHFGNPTFAIVNFDNEDYTFEYFNSYHEAERYLKLKAFW